MTALSFILFLCLVLGTVLSFEIGKTESDLRKDLFFYYDKRVRPVRSVGDVIPVQVSMTPIKIKDVDVKEKTVELDTWLYLRWNDSYLRWDPSEYGGLDELNIPASDVWKPDVSLLNASPDTSVFPPVLSNAIIEHDGTVIWAPPFSFKASCPVVEGQVTAETFRCTLELWSWTYDVRRVTVREREQDALQGGMTREFFKDTNEKWSLVSMVARSEEKLFSCCPEKYSLVKIDMLLRKKDQGVE